MQSEKTSRVRGIWRRRTRALFAAVSAASALFGAAGLQAGATGGSDQIFNISTSGATALGAFTRADGAIKSIMNLGTSSITIGGTTYTLDADGEALSSTVKSAMAGLDRWAYYYHETGSVEGILELADGYGLTTTSLRPFDATSGNPLYLSGNVFNATPELNDTTSPPTLTINGVSQKNGYILGRNYRNQTPGTSSLASTNPTFQIIPPGNQSASGTQYGQDLPKIAWSDVPTFQTFANPGPANPFARPLDDPATPVIENTAGYGKARPQGNSNFQKLRDIDAISGGQANFRNDSLAVVPFAVVANPGTGLAKVTEAEARWLHAVGRLPNGADFNVVTRDPGSGTRNQGGNNLGLDPSWASGERDRIIPSGTKSFTVVSPDGQVLTLLPGDEGRPLNLLDGGSSTLLRIEDRVGPSMRFSDKTSGGSRLVPAVLASRMAVGAHLSVGDVATRTDAYADAYGKSRQTRVLAIDWAERPGEPVAGYVQPTAENVTEGFYRFWSYSQAVTVRDLNNPNAVRPHDPAQHNTQYTVAQEAVLAGEARKFLDNIMNSTADFPNPVTNATPADGILQAGFIITQIMGTQKAYDGAVQVPRTRSTVDPDGPGPKLSEQAIWEIWKNAVGYGTTLNFADFTNFENLVPGYNPNTASSTQVKYDLYRRANTLATGAANADASITVTQRVALAGDFNNDQVRDLADVPAMARAYANPDAYLADASLGGPQVAAAAAHALSVEKPSLGGNGVAGQARAKLGLVVLSDFNANGNITAADNDTVAVERADVKWFLYGAAIDTSGFGTAKARREDGVRLGQLKKNQAIDTFNLTLDSFVGTLTNPATGVSYTQNEINELKFEKRDVDGSGSRAFASGDKAFFDDALIVDRFQGMRYTSLADQLNAQIARRYEIHPDDQAVHGTHRWVLTNFNLVNAELTDSSDGLIDQADLDVMNQALTATAGVNPTGRVDINWPTIADGVARNYNKVGSGTIVLAPGAGSQISVPAGGSKFGIYAGTLVVGGAVDPFSDNVGGLGMAAGQPGGRVELEVTGGTLTVDRPVIKLAKLTMGAGGTAILNAGGNKTLVTESLLMDGGSINLRDNDLLVETATLADVKAAIVAGRNNGMWNGNGIMSDLMGSDKALAYASGSDPVLQSWGNMFNGQPFDADSVIVKYTYAADANLDGQVDVVDLGILATNWQGENRNWTTADFNYSPDGKVDVVDLGILATNWQKGVGSPLSLSFADALGLFPQFSQITVVPEPGALGLLAIGAAALMRRRPRR